MNAAESLDWVEAQPKGKYELLQGEIIAMAPERAEHGRVKANIWRALAESSRRLDANAKLADVFRVPSVRHYLVADCSRRLVLHYFQKRGELSMVLRREGALALDPPGLSPDIADIFPNRIGN